MASKPAKLVSEITLSIVLLVGIVASLVGFVMLLSDSSNMKGWIVLGGGILLAVASVILNRRIMTPDKQSKKARSRRSAGVFGVAVGALMIYAYADEIGQETASIVGVIIGGLFLAAGLVALYKKPAPKSTPPKNTTPDKTE